MKATKLLMFIVFGLLILASCTNEEQSVDNTPNHCCPIKIAKRSLKYLKFSSLQRFFESTDLNL